MTLTDTIMRVLKRGPKKGLTAETIADRAGTKLTSTRTILSALAGQGVITVVGTEKRTRRPANLYAITA